MIRGKGRTGILGLSVNEWTLTLPGGTYYWSVQAIDTGFMGGAWATEQTVTVP